MMKRAIIAGLGVMEGSAAIAEHRPAADLIVYDAHIFTVSPTQPEAAAVAVLNGRFVAVGSDAEILRWRGPETRAIDAHGRRLLPGFNEAHVHLLDGSEAYASVHRNDATSVQEFGRRTGRV